MTPAEYTEMAQDTHDMLVESGRPLTLYKLGATGGDPAKPWRGAGAQQRIGQVDTYGVFAVPNTSIPTESRGLGWDWVDQDLLKRARRVCIIPAIGLPNLEDYTVMVDGSEEFVLIWGQCLKPGTVPILYVFGLAQ